MRRMEGEEREERGSKVGRNRGSRGREKRAGGGRFTE